MRTTSKRKTFDLKKYAVFLILVALVAVFSLLTPNFRTLSNMITILRQISMVGIISVGMTFVLITGGIDLSCGVMMGLIGVTSGVYMTSMGMPILLALLLGILICSAVGFVNGVAITYTKMPPLIATLGMMNVVFGLNYTLTNGLPVTGLPDGMKVIGQGYIWGIIPVSVIIMVAILVIGAFILNKTYIGRYIYAVGSNDEAARLSGINVNAIRVMVYTLGGAMAGVAGILMMSRLNSGQPIAGRGYEMDVITACVVGGVSTTGGEGSIAGMVIGLLVIGVLTNGMAVLGLGEFYQYMVKGVVLIVAVGLDSLQRHGALEHKATKA